MNITIIIILAAIVSTLLVFLSIFLRKFKKKKVNAKKIIKKVIKQKEKEIKTKAEEQQPTEHRKNNWVRNMKQQAIGGHVDDLGDFTSWAEKNY